MNCERAWLHKSPLVSPVMQTINGKANSLGTYEVFFGDYRRLYDAPKLYEKVSSEDIKRVAAKYFTARNRTVGYLLPEQNN